MVEPPPCEVFCSSTVFTATRASEGMSMPEWLRKRTSSRGDERRDDRRHLAAVEPDAQRRIGRKEVVVLHVGTVLHEERAEHLAVLGIDLRGEVAARILQLLERRQPSGRDRKP